MKAKTTKEVLKAVEWLLTNVGWCQGFNYRDTGGRSRYIDEIDQDPKMLGSMCILGAFELVEANPRQIEVARKHFKTVNYINYVSDFNDDKKRTKEEVLAAVRKAINES